MAGVLWVASASNSPVVVLPGQGCFAWPVGVLPCSGFLDRLCIVVGLGERGQGRATVRLEVRVGSAAVELRSLQGWLRADPEVHRSATVEVQGGVPGPGEMGTGLDVLQLVTGNGWSAASFVLAVVAWRQSRPQRPRVEIRRGDTVVVLMDCSQEEIERAVRALDAADPDEGGGR
ncbi:effector-associated constant component EACC1 [Streptomyces asiaticus]|uniref:effector-associated constant component EACC1 n=1 Tax=Streptomyces asiaticus TaxID=114695 RepID=UPI002ED5C858